MTRSEISQKLQQGIWNVTFTKVDGTERTMPCTLDPALLPPTVVVENQEKTVVRKLNMDTLRVFVTDIKEWRSFRIENLKSIEGV
jgi:inner membrane protein involved in colicin E2 resistance